MEDIISKAKRILALQHHGRNILFPDSLAIESNLIDKLINKDQCAGPVSP